MSAPIYVAAGTVSSSSTAGSRTPGLPSGWQQDDIFLLTVTYRTSALTVPSGWAHVTNSPSTNGTDIKQAIMWKRAGASESGPTVGSVNIARIHAIRGCVGTGDPWDVTNKNSQSNTSNVSITGVTTTVADCFVFHTCATGWGGEFISGWANSNLTGVQERTDNNDGGNTSLASGTGVKAATGATGATSADVDGGAAGAIANMMVALAPGAGAANANAGTAADTVTSNAPRGGVGAKAQVIG